MDSFSIFAGRAPNVDSLRAGGESKQAPDSKENDEAWEMAKKFEAAFISQMLVHSGFAKALTSSGGEDVAGFSQFYMESLAKDMSDAGGFGIAEDIYSNMIKKEGKHGNLGRL